MFPKLTASLYAKLLKLTSSSHKLKFKKLWKGRGERRQNFCNGQGR